MKNTLKISLKPNEKIYLNGAVITVDRKVTIELLNDVQFLLESHVLQIDDASTPLRQLYFILQVMLMNPTGANDAYEMFRRSLPLMIASFSDPEISGTLKQIDRMVGEGHVYEALKAIRGLYPLESKALGENDDAPAGQSQSGQSQSGQSQSGQHQAGQDQAGQRQAGQTQPEQLRAEPSRARAGAAS